MARKSTHRPPDAGSADEHAGLDRRKSSILKAVVTEYVQTAQPVGSGHLSGTPGIEVSPATVRAEMASLEREGYLTQPHTSAGRVPTDRGYRFFVDHLAEPGRLAPAQRHKIRSFYSQVHGEVEELLERTSVLLAGLTEYAAVVVGPGRDTAPICGIQLVRLSERVVLVVAVLADGGVEKHVLDIDDDFGDDLLASASSHLLAHLRGKGAGQSREVPVPPTGDRRLDALCAQVVEVLSDAAGAAEAEHVFVEGSSRIALAFDAVDTVRSVLAILEQQLVVVELIEDVLDRGLSVAIGAEHGFEPLASCALVIAPVAVDGELAGTVGVVGPTRMDYPRAVATVEAVGEQLGRRLAHRLDPDGAAAKSAGVARGARHAGDAGGAGGGGDAG